LFWAGNPSASIQQFRPYRRGSTGSSTVPGGSAQSLPRTCGQEALPLMTVASNPTAAATPAVRVLNLAGIDYSLRSFDHDPAARRYGSEAADKLGVSSDQVFKTLMIQVDGAPVTALVPVSGQLDLKGLASARGAKKAQLSGVAETERRTGYPVGESPPSGSVMPCPWSSTAQRSSMRACSSPPAAAASRSRSVRRISSCSPTPRWPRSPLSTEQRTRCPVASATHTHSTSPTAGAARPAVRSAYVARASSTSATGTRRSSPTSPP